MAENRLIMSDLLEEIDVECERARTNNFPRVYRMTVGADMMKLIGEMDETLWTAVKSDKRKSHLYILDAKTQRLKRILRKCLLLKLISPGQHELISRKVREFGAMLGKWILAEKSK